MTEEVSYEERYCAFVDILGFRTLISTLDSDPLVVGKIRDLLRLVYGGDNEPDYPQLDFHAADLRYQSISDAVCVSTKCNAAGLLYMFAALERLALRMLSEGYFTRGAIVKGRLYHDQDMAFGNALVTAYELEFTVARFPRIMISRQVAIELERYLSHEAYANLFENSVKRATDGPYYLHVLKSFTVFGGDDDTTLTDMDILTRAHATALQIQERLDASVDNPSHFEKVQWFANYWNVTVRALEGGPIRSITGPGLFQMSFLDS